VLATIYHRFLFIWFGLRDVRFHCSRHLSIRKKSPKFFNRCISLNSKQKKNLILSLFFPLKQASINNQVKLPQIHPLCFSPIGRK